MLKEADFTFKRKRKLKNKKTFQEVYKTGLVFVDKFAVIYVTANPDLQLKIGFAVGKKLGNAVLRNKVKRLMREVFRHTQDMIIPEYNIIFVARKALVTQNIDCYFQVWQKLIKKAKLLKG